MTTAVLLAATLMQVPADCIQIDTQAGKSTTSEYAATLVVESRGDGELTMKVNGPDSEYKGANFIATVKNVEVRRSASNAQLMGTNLETVRLTDRVTKYESFTSVRLDKTSARLVRMNEYENEPLIQKRSNKRVVECTLNSALGADDVAAIAEKVNGEH